VVAVVPGMTCVNCNEWAHTCWSVLYLVLEDICPRKAANLSLKHSVILQTCSLKHALTLECFINFVRFSCVQSQMSGVRLWWWGRSHS